MRYSLAIVKEHLNYNIQGYTNFGGFQDLNEGSLEDITKFTNSFINEEDLKLFLYHTGLLDKNLLNGRISINLIKKDTYKELDYGVSFKGHSKYFNFEYLTHYFCSHTRDKIFLGLFISRFYDYLKNVPHFTEPLNELNSAYIELCNGLLSEGAYDAMYIFLVKYLFRKGKNDIQFSRLRELAMFAINYENIQNPPVIQDLESTLSLEEINTQIKHYSRLLNSGDVTREQIEAYQSHIDELILEKEKIEQYTLCRRK